MHSPAHSGSSARRAPRQTKMTSLRCAGQPVGGTALRSRPSLCGPRGQAGFRSVCTEPSREPGALGAQRVSAGSINEGGIQRPISKTRYRHVQLLAGPAENATAQPPRAERAPALCVNASGVGEAAPAVPGPRGALGRDAASLSTSPGPMRAGALLRCQLSFLLEPAVPRADGRLRGPRAPH